MKKSALFSAALALALAAGCTLGGCSLGGNRTDGEIGELEDHKGTITIWWPGATQEMKAINEAKADYIALYPDVTINIIGQSTPDFYMSYSLACAGNNAPDIAYVDHVYVQTLAHYGYIANLSSAGYDDLEETFIPSLWTPGFYEGKLYGLPMSANVLATVYNKTILAKAQNTTTDKIVLPKNYEEFKALAQKIVALPADKPNEPYYAITVPAGTGHDSMAAMTFLSFVARSGGKGILTPDLQGSLLNSDACVDAATKLFELGSYSPQVFSESKFETGTVGFIEMGPWKISDYEKYSKEYGWEVGYTTAIPFTEGGSTGSTIGLYDLVVTANKNAALAADFAKFVTTSDKYQLSFATAQNLMPTTKSASEDEFYAGEVWQVFLEQLKNGVARPGSPAWTDIEQLLGSLVTGLVQHTAPQKIEDVRQTCVGYHEMVASAIEDINM